MSRYYYITPALDTTAENVYNHYYLPLHEGTKKKYCNQSEIMLHRIKKNNLKYLQMCNVIIYMTYPDIESVTIHIHNRFTNGLLFQLVI